MIFSKAYEDIVNFIASGTSPEKVIAFRPSKTTQDRVSELMSKVKSSGLTPEEKSEFDTYLLIEHLMRLAKARARQLLKK